MSAEILCRLVEQDVMELCIQRKEQKLYPNLQESDRKALMELMSHDEIVIRHADKGGAKVIQGKSAYVNEIKIQLSDRLIFTPLDTDPTFGFGQEIGDTLKCLERILDNEYKYVI